VFAAVDYSANLNAYVRDKYAALWHAAADAEPSPD
jgi:hypothetical protein